MWVVKLGGSLADGECLRRWLDALAVCPVIIVPGGGPFADAVRNAQALWHFDEQTAHDMAILAMRQYGRMMLGLHPGMRATPILDDLSAPPPCIWLPEPEILNAAGVPASWDITSDSLAAWLAVKLGAPRLLLVKSVQPDSQLSRTDCRDLIEQGLVDPAFREYGCTGGLQSWWCGLEDYAYFPEALNLPDDHFVRITANPRSCLP